MAESASMKTAKSNSEVTTLYPDSLKLGLVGDDCPFYSFA